MQIIHSNLPIIITVGAVPPRCGDLGIWILTQHLRMQHRIADCDLSVAVDITRTRFNSSYDAGTQATLE